MKTSWHLWLFAFVVLTAVIGHSVYTNNQHISYYQDLGYCIGLNNGRSITGSSKQLLDRIIVAEDKIRTGFDIKIDFIRHLKSGYSEGASDFEKLYRGNNKGDIIAKGCADKVIEFGRRLSLISPSAKRQDKPKSLSSFLQ